VYRAEVNRTEDSQNTVCTLCNYLFPYKAPITRGSGVCLSRHHTVARGKSITGRVGSGQVSNVRERTTRVAKRLGAVGICWRSGENPVGPRSGVIVVGEHCLGCILSSLCWGGVSNYQGSRHRRNVLSKCQTLMYSC